MNTVLPNSGFGAAVGFVYLFMAVIYIYPLIMGFQFANGTKAGCLNNDENELARGFEGMRSWFNYIGILTIICLVLYALIIIGAFIAGFAAASKF